MVNYACGLNQSETGKYFEWIISSNMHVVRWHDQQKKIFSWFQEMCWRHTLFHKRLEEGPQKGWCSPGFTYNRKHHCNTLDIVFMKTVSFQEQIMPAQMFMHCFLSQMKATVSVYFPWNIGQCFHASVDLSQGSWETSK